MPSAISVIIPTLNEADYLPRLLADLQGQTESPGEVIVVDAGSEDGTQDIVEAWGHRLVRGGGRPGFSRNLGSESANGDWLLFVDADVELSPHTLATLSRQMIHRRLDSCSTWFAPVEERSGLELNHWVSSAYFWLSTRMRWPHSIGGFLCVRADLHTAVRGFDTTITVAEDQDYVVRLARHGRYGFLWNPVVRISTRRFRREGSWKASLRWLRIEMRRRFKGEIRDESIPYFD